jgi:hypothetical protein
MRLVATSDLLIYRNTNFIHQLDFDTLNISTYTFYSKIRDKDNNFIENFTIDKIGNHIAQLSLSKVQTQDLEFDVYYYDIIQSVAGVEELILRGTINVQNTITNLV